MFNEIKIKVQKPYNASIIDHNQGTLLLAVSLHKMLMIIYIYTYAYTYLFIYWLPHHTEIIFTKSNINF